MNEHSLTLKIAELYVRELGLHEKKDTIRVGLYQLECLKIIDDEIKNEPLKFLLEDKLKVSSLITRIKHALDELNEDTAAKESPSKRVRGNESNESEEPPIKKVTPNKKSAPKNSENSPSSIQEANKNKASKNAVNFNRRFKTVTLKNPFSSYPVVLKKKKKIKNLTVKEESVKNPIVVDDPKVREIADPKVVDDPKVREMVKDPIDDPKVQEIVDPSKEDAEDDDMADEENDEEKEEVNVKEEEK